ncbi:unnamed protein product [Peronospora belbahrii]|uniref:Uncharacterized protein n=1 Tax=Peronospora belbahrii TaxID=622444 RepID=A0ABN8D730_9STRA|nr:unnamed protein product [Peronospora belbahrii]
MAPLAEALSPSSYDSVTVVKQKNMIQTGRKEDVESEILLGEEEDIVQTMTTDPATEQEELFHPALGKFVNVVHSGAVKKRVRFDLAEIVEFEPTMWTATVSSEGVPLGMSIDVRRRIKRPLEIYEIERVMQRIDRQEYMELGYLEAEERLDILENAGHSISMISHVERDTLRINRERWESNEYDLMYQYGLGEVPLIEDSGLEMMQQLDGDDIMHVDDSSENEFFFGGSVRNMVVDAEVCFAMEDMDAYDAINMRTYDDLSIDYASDCILGDDESSDENNELPYAIDSFDSPHSCDFLEMRTLPSDMSESSGHMLAAAIATSCAQSVCTTLSASSSTESTVLSVEVAPVLPV